MVKSLLIGGIALSAISAAPLAASAQTYGYNAPYNSACERQNQDNKTAGTVIGAIVGAAAGGAIGLVRDGDIIEIDIPGRTINVALSDQQLAAQACWRKRKARKGS